MRLKQTHGRHGSVDLEALRHVRTAAAVALDAALEDRDDAIGAAKRKGRRLALKQQIERDDRVPKRCELWEEPTELLAREPRALVTQVSCELLLRNEEGTIECVTVPAAVRPVRCLLLDRQRNQMR